MSELGKRDNIYENSEESVTPFRFDKKVVDVFQDMISRSVPGYAYTLEMIEILGQEFHQKDSNCYDLGCSLGASTISLAKGIQDSSVKIIAVDNSPEMIEASPKKLGQFPSILPTIEWICQDIRNIHIENASIIILNFTLQFIPLEERDGLISKIYNALNPNGILILSEKVSFPESRVQDLQTHIHHSFKKKQGYSELEIAQKRTALENVLIPETISTHEKRITDSGFKVITPWFQCFNFISFLAQK